MSNNYLYTFINDAEELIRFVSSLSGLSNLPPSLYIDLEGNKLGRHGTISIMQVFVAPHNHVYLLDISSLREKAFYTIGSDGVTLRSILESASILKVFFDVRHDSDALYNHFKVSLAGIVDLQLMELATRRTNRRYLNGLARCIERDLFMTQLQRHAWSESKVKGKQLFLSEYGGGYEVFDVRPLAEEIKEYCVQDVLKLPELWRVYWQKMNPQWDARVAKEVQNRVIISQQPTFNGDSRHIALTPSK